MPSTASVEKQIERKGLELGFSNVGFTALRDYPEYLEEARSRPNYEIFAETDDGLITRLSKAKTLNPWANGIVCATLGFSSIDYPENMVRSVARTYLARVYSPQPGTVHAFQVEALASFVEGLGMRVERNQFVVPQRIACAEAGITTFGNNNFAYTEQDGSFVILVTFLVDGELESSGSEMRNGCPEGCDLCAKACPTGAIIGPRKLDLERVLMLDEAYYEEVVRPIMYNYIKDMDIFRRNAAIALGSTGDPCRLPALHEAQACTDNPDVLKAIDWAIVRLEDEIEVQHLC